MYEQGHFDRDLKDKEGVIHEMAQSNGTQIWALCNTAFDVYPVWNHVGRVLDRPLFSRHADAVPAGLGQIWRFLTFLFLPSSSSPLWVLLNLYFYCLLGNALEKEWGTFRLNLFYLSGILGSVLAALVTGYGVNRYLNLSLFLAFAALYPNFELLLFFVVPVKAKYLAVIDLLYSAGSFFYGDWAS